MNDQHSSKVNTMKRHQIQTKETPNSSSSSTAIVTDILANPASDQTDPQSSNSERPHPRVSNSSKRLGHSRSQSKTRQVIRGNVPSKHSSNVGQGRKRAKFVFGDQDTEEDVIANQEKQQQKQQHHSDITDMTTTVPSPESQQESEEENLPIKQSRVENQDDGKGPNSETIPNSHQRNHSRRIGVEDNQTKNDNVEDNNCNKDSNTIKGIDKTETISKIDLNDSESIGSRRPLLENNDSVLQQESQTKKDAHTLGHSQDQKDGQTMVSQLDLGKGNFNMNAHNEQSPEITQDIKRSSATPTHQQPSKRLSHLLHPSRSTTSLTSITRTFSQPVLCATSPGNVNDLSSHRRNNEDSESSSASISALSATLRNEQAASTPVVDLVTNFLRPNRSRSYSNLSRNNQSSNLGPLGGSVFSPPRANDSTNIYLVSRFLPISPSHTSIGSSSQKFSSSPTSMLSPSFTSTSTNTPPNIKRRRIPAGLLMTSAGQSVEGDRHLVRSISVPTTPTTPSRPTTPNSISSFQSSAEGRAIYDTPETGNQSTSPWNPEESMSRTQQKLMLQKASSLDDMDEREMARRGKYLKEMDKVQREYRCVNLHSSPLLDSLLRCQLRLQKEQRLAETQGETQSNPKAELAQSMTLLSK